MNDLKQYLENRAEREAQERMTTQTEALKLAQKWQTTDWNTENPMSADIALSEANSVINALIEVLAQPEQEPAGITDDDGNAWMYGYLGPKFPPNIELYTTPPQHKPWVTLSDEDVAQFQKVNCVYPKTTRAIEAKLRELNEVK